MEYNYAMAEWEKNGKPYKPSEQEIRDYICKEIASGEVLSDVLIEDADSPMPDFMTVVRWRSEDMAFENDLHQAEVIRCNRVHDKIIKLVRDSSLSEHKAELEVLMKAFDKMVKFVEKDQSVVVNCHTYIPEDFWDLKEQDEKIYGPDEKKS